MAIKSFAQFSGGQPVVDPHADIKNLPSPEMAQTDASLTERLGNIGLDAADKIKADLEGTGDKSKQTPLRRGIDATAEAFNVVPKATVELLPKPAREAVHAVGEVAGKGIKWLTDAIASTPGLASFVFSHPKIAGAIEEVAGIGAGAGTIAGDILMADQAAKGAQFAVDKVQEAAPIVAAKTARATDALVKGTKDIVNPQPTAREAVGEVLQGKADDVNLGIRALGSRDASGKPVVNTEGVKTYAQLEDKLDDAIGDLSAKVDTHLAQDPTKFGLDDLVVQTTSKGGKTISTNYVSTALDQLDELYKTTGDATARANIEELIQTAKTDGLTRLEVNDLSRVYNQEFGSKAFGKTGDPLTSVNAQMYENVRTGLKDTARQGMGGAEALETDKVISSLYNTRDLVKRNMEAVNKLTQRIADRGLMEKFGHAVSKYSNILTGGTLRGFIGGLLPRGAGYKVLNALDLEERLAQNLKIINEAVASGTDDAIMKAVKVLSQDPTDATLFHGASSATAESIRANGFKGSTDFPGSGMVSLTPDVAEAGHYAHLAGNGDILPVIVKGTKIKTYPSMEEYTKAIESAAGATAGAKEAALNAPFDLVKIKVPGQPDVVFGNPKSVKLK